MSEPGRTEQIISQFLLKALHAVLAARIPHLHRPHRPRPRRRDRWFNLPLPDLPSSLDSVPSPSDPLIIDILLLSGGHETIVERWTAACDPAPPSPASDHRGTYKKSIVLLRSLYSLLRFLPAYRAFRLLSGASHHAYNHDIAYRVSSFAEPFSREEEAQLTPHAFAPVDTQFGQLSVSVMYRPTLSDFSFEVSSLVPPTIIADYVGSPAAEPMKPFPEKGIGSIPSSTSAPLRAAVPPALTRPHSWTSAPMAHRPLSRSPTMATVHQKGFDVFRLSPPLSTSPSPSPPAAYSGNSSRLRSETAPVSIPQQGKSLLFRSPNLSDPSRSPLPPLSPRGTRAADHSSQESPSESRSFRKLEGLRAGDYYSNLHWYATQKGCLKDGRDDSGRFSGVLSSGGSPGFGISRSSSRLSIQDDLDDCDFSYPFAVDDVDTSDSQTRNIDRKQASESAPTSTSSHKSQDAAVGVLVHMLKTAPPLRPDHSYSQSSNSEVGGEVGTSSFFLPRKASDALEELQSYRKMKEILLSQSGTQLLDSINHRGK